MIHDRLSCVFFVLDIEKCGGAAFYRRIKVMFLSFSYDG